MQKIYYYYDFMRQIFSIVVLLFPFLSFAQPANDACSNATALPCGTTNLAGNTTGAVSETHGTGCTMSGLGVWYTFTGDGNPTTITATPTGFNLVLAITSGSCGSLTNVSCTNANGSGVAETYSFTTTNAVTYYVYIAPGGAATNVSFTISRSCTTPPSNDACSGATPLPCGTTNLAGTTVGTVSETSPGGCGFSSYGVWYSFTGSGVSTTISATSAMDIGMSIVSGSCGSFTNVACDDDNGASSTETYTFTPTNGVTYYVYIAYWQAGATTGTFTISNSCAVPPVNDACGSATPLPCGTTNLAGTTANTVSETPGTGCTISNYGVWYTFAGDGNLTTISSTGAFDHEMAIVSGSCGSFTNISCQDVNGSGGTESYSFTTAVGTNYYVYIAYYTTGATTGTFTISRTCTIPPSNDACASATSLPCGTTNLAGTTVGTSLEIPGTGCTLSGYGVWYTFTGDGNISTISSTAAFDHEMAIVSGSCGSFTNITCQDGPGAGGTETYTFTTVNGTNYYVYIAYYTTGATTGTFTISRSCTAAPTPPANDLCSNATTIPCGTSGLAGTTVNSVSETAPSVCGMSNYGVWYTFTGDGGMAALTLQGNSYDTGLGLYSGGCGSLTNITCEDAFSASDPENYTFATTAGVNYYVYVAYYTSSSTTGTFTISHACPTATAQDCPGAIQVCDDQTMSGNSGGYGVQEINSSNYGCLAGGVSEEEDQSSWYFFQATNNGTVEFVLNSEPGVDYDFLIWGPGSGCGSLGAPIRCNASEVDEITGMVTTNPSNGSAVTNTSSNPGPSSTWIKSLDVSTGQFYIMMINNFTANSTPFSLDWTFSVPDLLNCDPIVLPITFSDFTGYYYNSSNLLFWRSQSEVNNAYYTIERSTDGEYWENINTTIGAANSTQELNYSFVDRNYYRNKFNYYRLSQTDFDGNRHELKTISIDNTDSAKTISRRINLLGQEVDENYRGVVILEFEDGTILKTLQ